MNLPNIGPLDFLPLWPAMVLGLGAILLLLSEVFLSTASRTYQSALACATSLIAMGLSFRLMGEAPREIFLGFGAMDPFSSAASAVICLATALASVASAGFLHRRHAERGEYYALMLFGAAGMSLLAMSAELITLFINLEVLSVATYALTAYLRRGSRPSEAGFKYFILGAFSTALVLYGTSLLYGVTGSTLLQRMSGPLASAMKTGQSGLALCGLLLVAAGFAFKVAAVPFHMWTPDVYEGAPTPVTALMSAGVKAAAFAAMVRVFVVLGKGLDPVILTTVFAALAVATMVVGNLLAVPQRNVKRMLAYSSIAHAGYLLAGVTALFAQPGKGESGVLAATPLLGGVATSAMRAEAAKGIVFYLLAYTVSAVGAFVTVSALERREDEDRGTAWDLDRFSGLAQRRPGWAFAMAAFMLSLGGIPPTVGFMGKLLIFRSAVDVGLLGVAVVGVLSSAVGVYYYLRVVVYMYMRPAAEDAPAMERNLSTELVLAATTVAVVALGVLPGPLGSWLSRAGQIWGQ
ncbi:MAG TPA: NADH-quinone oxidoreductase subunit N [Myxococcaceae bacterium]